MGVAWTKETHFTERLSSKPVDELTTDSADYEHGCESQSWFDFPEPSCDHPDRENEPDDGEGSWDDESEGEHAVEKSLELSESREEGGGRRGRERTQRSSGQARRR